MTSPGTANDKTSVEILAEHGRPVSAERLARARTTLAAADAGRDHGARAELLDRLRTAA